MNEVRSLRINDKAHDCKPDVIRDSLEVLPGVDLFSGILLVHLEDSLELFRAIQEIVQDHLFSLSVEHAISLVVSQLVILVILLKDGVIFLQRSWVLAQGFVDESLDGLPHSNLVYNANWLHLCTLEDVMEINIVRVIVRILLVLLSLLLVLVDCFVLGQVEHSHVLLVLNVSDPRNELVHDFLLEVVHHSELVVVLGGLVDELHLEIVVGICLRKVDHQWHLVCVIVWIDEPVVEEEARVAFLSIAVIDLLTSGDIVTRLNNEALSLIAVIPSGLPRSLVVEHVCVWDESISLHTLDGDAEDPARDHHSDLRVLLQRELLVLWHLLADKLIVDFDVFDFLIDLVQEWTSSEELLLVFGEKDWEVSQALWEDVEVLCEGGIFLASLLEQISSQK